MNWRRILASGLVVCTLTGIGGTAWAEELNVTDDSVLVVSDDAAAQTVQEQETVAVSLDGINDYEKAYELLGLINAKRKTAGLDALTMDIALLGNAMSRAAECNVYYAHQRPNGTSYIEIVEDGYGDIAESIAAKQATAQAVASAWSARKADEGRMLNDNYTAVGIGCFHQPDGSLYWTAIYTDAAADKAVQPKNEDVCVTMQALPKNIGEMHFGAAKTKLMPGETAATVVYIDNAKLTANGGKFYPSLQTLKFTSSEEDVASIRADGIITAVKDGTAVITASVDGMDGVKSIDLTVKTPFSQRVPQNVAVVNRSEGAKVTWDAVKGAKLYLVFRSDNGGAYRQIQTVSKTGYTDKSVRNGVLYRYKIVGSTGKTRTRDSASKNVYRLSTMSIQSVTAGRTTLKVKWVSNAMADGYEIEYAVPGGEPTTAIVESGTRRSLTLKELAGGETYTVRMRSYKKRGARTYYAGWGKRVNVKTLS